MPSWAPRCQAQPLTTPSGPKPFPPHGKRFSDDLAREGATPVNHSPTSEKVRGTCREALILRRRPLATRRKIPRMLGSWVRGRYTRRQERTSPTASCPETGPAAWLASGPAGPTKTDQRPSRPGGSLRVRPAPPLVTIANCHGQPIPAVPREESGDRRAGAVPPPTPAGVRGQLSGRRRHCTC